MRHFCIHTSHLRRTCSQLLPLLCRVTAQKGVPLALLLSCLSITRAAAPDFERQPIDEEIKVGYGIAIGHVDDDERPDILIADKTEIAWYQNPGSRNQPWPRHVMARNLTSRDNVCIAARDLDGDGLVEVAVGANWNPGETTDPEKSGALFYLKRPTDPTAAWTPVTIVPHDPTVHRMHWVKTANDQYALVVLPLHGRGNRNGEGDPVRVQAYLINPADGSSREPITVDESMHMTHNFEVVNTGEASESLLLAGREGLRYLTRTGTPLSVTQPVSRGAGEVRFIDVDPNRHEATAIEPMHGSDVVLYQQQDDGSFRRILVDTGLNQGHALVADDFLGLGRDQIVAGWRNPDSDGKVGVRFYVPNEAGDRWERHVLDDNQMACEDLRAADLDGDGKPDIIAAGRATENLVIYWNDTDR